MSSSCLTCGSINVIAKSLCRKHYYAKRRIENGSIPRQTNGMSALEKIDFYSIPIPESGCFVWTASIDNSGYGVVVHQQIKYKAHRLAYELAYGKIPKGLIICHKCDNPACVNVNHLFAGTHQDNMSDMVAKHRSSSPFGAAAHKAKLSEDLIQLIRNEPGTQQSIADKYGVSKATISKVKSLQTWKHV